MENINLNMIQSEKLRELIFQHTGTCAKDNDLSYNVNFTIKRKGPDHSRTILFICNDCGAKETI